MNLPRVHNKKAATAPASAVYIGRPSPYGNPFAIGTGASRTDVIRKYERWVCAQPALLSQIRSSLCGKDLVCFCKPEACHGDALLLIANNPYLYSTLMSRDADTASETGKIDGFNLRLHLAPPRGNDDQALRLRFADLDLLKLSGRKPVLQEPGIQIGLFGTEEIRGWSQVLFEGQGCVYEGNIDVSIAHILRGGEWIPMRSTQAHVPV